LLKSGIQAKIAGVMLAFAIPFSAKDGDEESPSHKLEHLLHKPFAFIILPIFALSNTGIFVGSDWMQSLTSRNSVGIMAGLIAGEPLLGVTLLCFVVVASGICHLPPDLNWRHVIGAGILGGIGFTMSIFITNLAFAGNTETISKDLKKRSFNFVGTTICYAFMQAVGMVNDHVVDCFRFDEVKKASQQDISRTRGKPRR
jgi:NhaA family Na+:H+ antiporter